jgi:putative phosphoesterase
MRILLVSDIHANIEALTAIEEDFDVLLCMGDLVDYGPSPKECIEWLRLRATAIVRGNHDNAVAYRQDCGCHKDYKLLSVATRQLTWDLLDRTEVELLRRLPLTKSLSLGGARFCLCHAAPSDTLFKYIPANAPEAIWQSEVEGINADFLLLGHTHMPFKREIGGKWIVNPGSVGQPKGNGPLASYAIWEDGEVLHKQTPYNHHRTIERIERTALDTDVKLGLAHVLCFGALAEPAPARSNGAFS